MADKFRHQKRESNQPSTANIKPLGLNLTVAEWERLEEVRDGMFNFEVGIDDSEPVDYDTPDNTEQLLYYCPYCNCKAHFTNKPALAWHQHATHGCDRPEPLPID